MQYGQEKAVQVAPLIVFDVSNLAYRAFHVLHDLSFDGVRTAVAFGVLRDIISLGDLFGTRRFAFAFDVGRPLRSRLCVEYKANRKAKEDEDPQVAAARKEVRNQINLFRDDILPALGYQNIFYQEGYEADDMIAAVCDVEKSEIVIVGTDQDLFQLISPRVSIWNPIVKRMVTKESFEEKYGISPAMWPDVKALTGCKSDNVPGIQGIGEKTAIKFLCGNLKPGKAFDTITRNSAIWRENDKLVRLPFPDLAPIKLVPDTVSVKKWQAVLNWLGIHSIRYS